MTSTVLIREDVLKEFAADLFRSAGASNDGAVAIAECLVDSNLRGHDSHGVLQIPGYVDQINTGELVPDAELEIVTETSGAVVADAHFGFGFVHCGRVIERMAPKARAAGIACATIRNCGHVGRLGTWTERVARMGLAGLMTANDNGVLQCVAPPGGTVVRISTNPIAIAIPTPDEQPLALDISTSAVANGKAFLAHVEGRECPDGWLLDADGNPTTDPAVRFSDPRGTLRPMGGDQDYKGFGLGLMLDLLVGGLSGGLCPPADESAKLANNVLIVSWDPERFAGSGHFKDETQKLIEYVRDTPLKAGVDRIRLPGDRALTMLSERRANGIPIEQGTWRSLVALAAMLKVTVPKTSAP